MNLRKLIKERTKERKSQISNTYVIQQPVVKPQYYRTKMK